MLFPPTSHPSDKKVFDVLGFLVVVNRQVHSYQMKVIEDYLEAFGLEVEDTGIADIVAGAEIDYSLEGSLSVLEDSPVEFAEGLYKAMVVVAAVDGAIELSELEILDKVAAAANLGADKVLSLVGEAEALAESVRSSSNRPFGRRTAGRPEEKDKSLAALTRKLLSMIKSWFHRESVDEKQVGTDGASIYAEAIERCAAVALDDYKDVEVAYDRVIGAGVRAVEELSAMSDSLPADTDLAAGTSEVIKAFSSGLRANALEQVRLAQTSLEQKRRTVGDFTISLVGRTKAGKSTLHSVLTNQGYESIGAGMQRTTRYNRVYQWNLLRIIDTPGIGSAEAAGRTDDEIAESVLGESDIVCVVVVDDNVPQDVLDLIEKVAKRNKPVVVILNHKDNIKADVKFRRFIADPAKWRTTEGEARLSGHIDRIMRFAEKGGFASTVQVYPVFLLAAMMSGMEDYAEYQELLWENSNIDAFIDELEGWIVRSGTIKRSQTILDEATCLLDDSRQQIIEAQGSIDEEIGSLRRQRAVKVGLLEEAQEKAVRNIRVGLEAAFEDLATNEALAFAESTYDAKSSEIGSLWKRHVESIGFEDRVRTLTEAEVSAYQKRASDIVDELFEDCLFSLQTSFVVTNANLPIQIDFRSITRLMGAGLGVIGAILLAVGAGGPIGLIFVTAGTVVGLGSNLFMPQDKRRIKAVDEIYSKINKSVREQAPAAIKKATDEIALYLSETTKKVDGLFSELEEGLLKSSAIAEGLIDCCGDQEDFLNRAYATRIVQFLSDGIEAAIDGSSVDVQEVDRSQKGSILIKCGLTSLDATRLEGVIADKVVIE